jgi:hypothetical protein
MNQLWRNQLLGLAIEQDAAQPYEQVTFFVVRHPRNDALDKTLGAYRNLIGANPKFTTFTSAQVIAAATKAGSDLKPWIEWYQELYDI